MPAQQGDAVAPPGPSIERDGVVIILYLELVILLFAGLTGSYKLFGYTLAALLGTFGSMGFARRAHPSTWGPPILSTAFLIIGMTGVFLTEGRVVTTEADTVLGFHPAVAFLVYVIWIPSFFIVGLGYTLSFNRLYQAKQDNKRRRRAVVASEAPS